MSGEDSLEERRVRAQEMQAEAALKMAEVAEKRLVLANAEQEDRRTLMGGLRSILEAGAGYMQAIVRQEGARAAMLEATAKFAQPIELPSGEDGGTDKG